MNTDMPGARPILEEDLHAYVDDRLDAQRRAEVQDYLQRHPEAARKVAGFSVQRQGLRDALAGIADEPIPPRLNLRRMTIGRAAARPRQWRMAAAVFLSFAIGGYGGWSVRSAGIEAPARGIAALAREATSTYAVHALDTQRPVEMGPEDQAELVDWVSSRLKRPIAIPDLTAAGYHFIGGRLVSTEHGPAGLFLYDSGQGGRVAMLVRPMAIEGETSMMKRSDGPIAGFTWATGGLGYSVVGTERPDALHPLANEVRRQIARML